MTFLGRLADFFLPQRAQMNARPHVREPDWPALYGLDGSEAVAVNYQPAQRITIEQLRGAMCTPVGDGAFSVVLRDAHGRFVSGPRQRDSRGRFT